MKFWTRLVKLTLMQTRWEMSKWHCFGKVLPIHLPSNQIVTTLHFSRRTNPWIWTPSVSGKSSLKLMTKGEWTWYDSLMYILIAKFSLFVCIWQTMKWRHPLFRLNLIQHWLLLILIIDGLFRNILSYIFKSLQRRSVFRFLSLLGELITQLNILVW